MDTDAISSKGALTDEEVTQKFFNVPADAPLAVRRAAEEMKRRNRENEYAVKFAKQNGYPVWDKANVIAKHQSSSTNFSASVTGDDDTTVIIPLVAANAVAVSNFISAGLSGGVSLSLYRGGDYSAYSFSTNLPPDSISANKAALQIMLLNREVFGYTRFRTQDKRLFHASPNYGDTGHLTTIITLSGSTAAGGGSSLFQECTTTTITTISNHCPQPAGWCSGPHGTCDNCRELCADITSETTTTCGPWTEGGEGPSTGPGGQTPGGGGAGTNPGFPCASSQGRQMPVANPCGPAPNPGPPVVPEPNPETPCEKAKRLAKEADSLFIKSGAAAQLATINLSSAQVEFGFPLIASYLKNTPNQGDTTITGYRSGAVHVGTLSGISYTITDMLYYDFQAGALHSHPASAYPAPSAFDVYRIIEKRFLQESHYSNTFVAAADGSQYAISISDNAAAVAFLATKSQYLNGNDWDVNSIIGKAFLKAQLFFEDKYKGNPNSTNLAYEMAMAAVLKEYNTGLNINKKDNAGNFQPIIVNTTIPNPNKPNKKNYKQDCN